MLDTFLVLTPIAMVLIALLLACALRVTRRRRTGASRVAGDPFFFPFGEMPNIPRERHLIAGDYRAWRVPRRDLFPSASAPPRIEGGGRPIMSRSGTAVVLTFPRQLIVGQRPEEKR
jgi:hypothetical protein